MNDLVMEFRQEVEDTQQKPGLLGYCWCVPDGDEDFKGPFNTETEALMDARRMLLASRCHGQVKVLIGKAYSIKHRLDELCTAIGLRAEHAVEELVGDLVGSEQETLSLPVPLRSELGEVIARFIKEHAVFHEGEVDGVEERFVTI